MTRTKESIVKKRISTILIGLTLLSMRSYGIEDIDVTQQNLGSEKMISIPLQKRNQIFLRGDWIGSSRIDKRKYRRQHVSFRNIELQGESIFYYNPTCKEGLAAGLAISQTRFQWGKNPFFRGHHFNLLSLTLTGFSERVPHWLFQGYITANWEYEYSKFSDYTSYDCMLWSRYEYCPNIFNIHAGFLLQTGMKIDRICPIIGFDWRFADCWKLNAVFPLNMSVVYDFAEDWSAALAGRIFDVRFRVGPHERLREALFEYYNYGVEFACNYAKNNFGANIHAGMTLGGEFKISNREHKRKKHFEMTPAPYFGGEVTTKF